MTPLAKFARLSLVNFEDRITPATASYLALTQTLTITAAQGDQLAVAAVPGEPTGYLKITETQSGNTVFNSTAAGRSVRNLIVKFDAVQSGGFVFNADARIGGSLALRGAMASQTVDVLGTVGGNLTYTGHALGAFDEVDFEASAVVGGNMNLALAGGPNTTRIKGGTVRGNVAVTGTWGDDRVELGEAGNVTINGSAKIQLGGGTNTVHGMGLAPTIRVQANFSYFGGGGNDTFDFDSLGATLNVGANARFATGTSMAFDGNIIALEALRAGRHITFTGSAGNDTLTVSGALEAGGNVSVNLGAGDNTFNTNLVGMGVNVIGGSLTYKGGSQFDHVSIDGTRIGRNMTIGLGENLTAGQSLFVGLNTPSGVTVFGNVKVTGGSGDDGILLRRMYVGGNLAVQTFAGEDTVTIDDTNVAGKTLVDLGAGADLLQGEMLTNDGGGSLSAATTFGGTFTVRGGDGADTLHLSDDGNASTLIKFGGKVAFIGGNGSDSLGNGAENVYKLTGNLNDFDTVTGPIVL